MTRQEQLRYCKKCIHRHFNTKKGIICNLTADIADFEVVCENYIRDENVVIQEPAQLTKKEPTAKISKEKKQRHKKIPEKITKYDRVLITFIVLINLFVIRLFFFITMGYQSGSNFLTTSISLCISVAVALLFRSRKEKSIRIFGDMKLKLLFSFQIATLHSIYIFIISPYQIISVFFANLFLAFFSALSSYLIAKPIQLLNPKILKERKRPPIRLLWISGILVLLLLLVQQDLFIKRETIYWNSKTELKWSNFRGYIVPFSTFSAAIHSSFDYSYTNKDSLNSIQARAYMHPHHSWAKSFERDSEQGLRHEQYHFNISEIVARKFKKTIQTIPEKSLSKSVIRAIYLQHLNELNEIQNKYDYDTDHSLLLEKQKDWEYLIDSMLVELEYYSKPDVFKPVDIYAKNNYYKEIEINCYNEIVGKFPIDSSIASHSKHYRFYYSGNKITKIEYRDRNKLATDELMGASIIKLNGKKYSEEWSFYNSDGMPTVNQRKVHLIKLLKKSKIIEKTYFDINKKPIEDFDGIHKVTWKLDHKDRKYICRTYNLLNVQVPDKKGYFITHNRYDKNNNLIEQGNYNEYNELEEMVNGIAYYQYTYDQFNNLTDYYSFDINKNQHPFEDNVASVHYKYDLNGNIIRQHFKNINGQIIQDDQGKSLGYFEYDQYSNITNERYFGLNKNLIVDENGFGQVIRKYDTLGRIIENHNYDAYNLYLDDNEGVCLNKLTYNKQNLIIREKQYSSDSLYNPGFLKTIDYVYDNLNRLVEESYYDSLSHPMADTNNIFKIRFRYNNRNNLIRIDYFNTTKKPQLNHEGAATIKYKYDDRNNKIETSYYDEYGNLKETISNIALEKYAYNKRNALIEKEFYNNKKQLTPNTFGVEIIQWEYDSKGNTISESYLDKNRKPTTDSDGVSTYKYTYNNKNQNIKTFCYNKNNQLVKYGNKGIAIIEYIYSKKGNHIRTTFYDKNNQLKNISKGYAIEEFLYDNSDRHYKTIYYSEFKKMVVGSEGFASVERKYDNNNNIVAYIFRDENEELIDNSDGYAIYNMLYNRNGNVISITSYNSEQGALADIDYGPFIETVQHFFPYYTWESNNDTRLQTTYYNNGQKKTEVMYVEGKLTGTYKSWYKTGELESIIEYEDGARNGKCIEYYENGNRSREMIYQNNNLVIESEITWHENGALRSKYVDGERKEWDMDGNVIIIVSG